MKNKSKIEELIKKGNQNSKKKQDEIIIKMEGHTRSVK